MNRAPGTHSTKRYNETLSALRFGERHPRVADSTLEWVAMADSATTPGAGGADKSESRLDPGVEKATIELCETVRFADGSAMV